MKTTIITSDNAASVLEKRNLSNLIDCVELQKAIVKSTTKQIAASKIRQPKKPVNKIEYSTCLALNKKYNLGSLSRVLAFLNDQNDFLAQCGINKPLTIADLKALCPEYCAPLHDKKGNIKVRSFSAFPFITEMRKLYGI